MNRKKKTFPFFLLELMALVPSLLLLYSCEKENTDPEGKRYVLEKILKDARERTGASYYDLITEGTSNGEFYYEVWSGICYPGFPVYYTSEGEFFCSNYHEEEERRCWWDNKSFEFTGTEVLYRTENNCFEASPVNKYNIKPKNSCQSGETY